MLEHISLTSHFLLILIDKAVTKALKNINNLSLTKELADYHFEKEKLDEVGLYKSFEWIRPEHMEPTGQVPLVQVRETIQTQLNRCLEHLQNMPNGEGVLYKTTMTVNNLGKIDVYEYIYFLAKHAERHIAQMERNESEYLQIQTDRIFGSLKTVAFMSYQNIIVRDKDILGGKPIVKGTRISVELILKKLSKGATVSDLLRNYPHLQDSQVYAALRESVAQPNSWKNVP